MKTCFFPVHITLSPLKLHMQFWSVWKCVTRFRKIYLCSLVEQNRNGAAYQFQWCLETWCLAFKFPSWYKKKQDSIAIFWSSLQHCLNWPKYANWSVERDGILEFIVLATCYINTYKRTLLSSIIITTGNLGVETESEVWSMATLDMSEFHKTYSDLSNSIGIGKM